MLNNHCHRVTTQLQQINIIIIETVCVWRFCRNCYKYCLNISFFPSRHVRNIICTPKSSMWVHSKLDYVSELPSIFSDLRFQQEVSMWVDDKLIVLRYTLSVAFFLDVTSVCRVWWPLNDIMYLSLNMFEETTVNITMTWDRSNHIVVYHK